jgi:hypothetical protein
LQAAIREVLRQKRFLVGLDKGANPNIIVFFFSEVCVARRRAQLGKLLVFASGKVKLLVGDVLLNLALGVPSACRQVRPLTSGRARTPQPEMGKAWRRGLSGQPQGVDGVRGVQVSERRAKVCWVRGHH